MSTMTLCMYSSKEKGKHMYFYIYTYINTHIKHIKTLIYMVGNFKVIELCFCY